MMVGFDPDEEDWVDIFDTLAVLIASAGADAGARAAGDPAEEGVDTVGDAIAAVFKDYPMVSKRIIEGSKGPRTSLVECDAKSTINVIEDEH